MSWRTTCHARKSYTFDGASGGICGADRIKRLSQKRDKLRRPNHLSWTHELTGISTFQPARKTLCVWAFLVKPRVRRTRATNVLAQWQNTIDSCSARRRRVQLQPAHQRRQASTLADKIDTSTGPRETNQFASRTGAGGCDDRWNSWRWQIPPGFLFEFPSNHTSISLSFEDIHM